MPSTTKPPSQLVDEIDLLVSGLAENTEHVLIFFVPGNPGLTSYYDDLLTGLRDLLARPSNDGDHDRSTTFHIHGGSLAGFDVGSTRRTIPSLNAQYLPASLDTQTADTSARVETAVYGISSTFGIKTKELPVILVGHSIGAYICFETGARYQLPTVENKLAVNIVACIGLFPTVFELADSPMGRKVGVSAG
jgi:pimeloyl-ACP methyl ester carboxylesterase